MGFLGAGTSPGTQERGTWHGLLEAFGFPGLAAEGPSPLVLHRTHWTRMSCEPQGPLPARAGGRGAASVPALASGPCSHLTCLCSQAEGTRPQGDPHSARLRGAGRPRPRPRPLAAHQHHLPEHSEGKYRVPRRAAQSPGSSLRTHSQLWGRLLFKSSPGDSDPQLASPGTHRPFLPRGSAAGGCAADARLCLRPDPPREGEAAAASGDARAPAMRRAGSPGVPRASCVAPGCPWAPLAGTERM